MAAAGMGNIRREEEAPVERLHQAGLLAIFTCSMAITLAMREPPLGFNKIAYFLALTGAFFAGVAGVVAAAVCVTNNPRGRRAAGMMKLVMYASVVGPLAVAVGLSVASLLW